MRISDFDYELPAELIAQRPALDRSASRLIVVEPGKPGFSWGHFHELPRFLKEGDLLVFNDTRVLPARLHGRKATGGKVELLIDEILGEFTASVRTRSSKALRKGEPVHLGNEVEIRCIKRDGELSYLEFSRPVRQVLLELGRVPLPPYIKRADDFDDAERYQTIYARKEGAVAAPTAGLHFDKRLLAEISDAGIASDYLTLHVGAGTFQPVRCADPAQHRMHSEWMEITETLVTRIREVKATGGRVIAVGTTCVRALESVAAAGPLEAYYGKTELFITPGFRFRVVDALITNFHLPRSTLLMMVSAFAGRQCILDAYRFAIERRFRFFSYGDAMFIAGPSVK